MSVIDITSVFVLCDSTLSGHPELSAAPLRLLPGPGKISLPIQAKVSILQRSFSCNIYDVLLKNTSFTFFGNV